MKRALLFTIALLGVSFLATGSSYATATLVLGPLSGNPVANFDPALLTQTSEDKPVDAPDDLHAELIDKDGNSVWKIEPVESETDEAESESADETEAGSETEEETVQAPDGVAPAEVEVQQIPPGKYTLYVEQASTGLFGATEVVIEECQKCAEEDAEDEGCDECKERRRRERAIIFFLSPKGLKELKGIHLCDGHMGQDCHCDEHCVCRYFDHFCTPAVSPCGETFKNRGSNNNPPKPQQPNSNPSSPQTPPQTPPTPGMGGGPWWGVPPIVPLPFSGDRERHWGWPPRGFPGPVSREWGPGDYENGSGESGGGSSGGSSQGDDEDESSSSSGSSYWFEVHAPQVPPPSVIGQ